MQHCQWAAMFHCSRAAVFHQNWAGINYEALHCITFSNMLLCLIKSRFKRQLCFIFQENIHRLWSHLICPQLLLSGFANWFSVLNKKLSWKTRVEKNNFRNATLSTRGNVTLSMNNNVAQVRIMTINLEIAKRQHTGQIISLMKVIDRKHQSDTLFFWYL